MSVAAAAPVSEPLRCSSSRSSGGARRSVLGAGASRARRGRAGGEPSEHHRRAGRPEPMRLSQPPKMALMAPPVPAALTWPGRAGPARPGAAAGRAAGLR